VELFERLRAFRRYRGAAPVRIGGLSIREVRPVKLPHGGNAINKANRLVLAGRTDSGPVKIYEAATAEHAEFIRDASRLGCDDLRFPAVLATAGRFVISEWAAGRPLSTRSLDAHSLESLARLQIAIHQLPTAPLPPVSFDYWEDFLVPRFMRSAALLGHESAAEAAVGRVRLWRSDVRATINHPDLSLDNVLVSQSGALMPIDNELLHVGGGAFMDVVNTLRSLPAPRRAGYLEVYGRLPDAAPLPGLPVLGAFWLARQAGALFVAGEIDRLRLLFEQADRAGDGGEEMLAPLFGRPIRAA
jgi:hypothetical protein